MEKGLDGESGRLKGEGNQNSEEIITDEVNDKAFGKSENYTFGGMTWMEITVVADDAGDEQEGSEAGDPGEVINKLKNRVVEAASEVDDMAGGH